MSLTDAKNDGAKRRLLVILSDPISPLISKGEVTARYYNPCNRFEYVDFLLLNDDNPDPNRVQEMVGRANFRILNHPLPARYLLKSLGGCGLLMRSWINEGIGLAIQPAPDVIRCFGPFANATIGRHIARVCEIPMLISLHHRPDSPPRGLTWREKARWFLSAQICRRELVRANEVIMVYESQRNYLEQIGVKNVSLSYNVVSPDNIHIKTDYRLKHTCRVLSVGRLIRGKNPENLIRAISKCPNCNLDIVGSGELEGHLKALVEALGCQERVTFVSSIPNSELAALLPDYDLFVIQCDYPGVPKTVLEAMLAGLPVVVSQNPTEPVPEYSDNICIQVENSVSGYLRAINELASSKQLRLELGNSARRFAEQKWHPDTAERRQRDIYDGYLH